MRVGFAMAIPSACFTASGFVAIQRSLAQRRQNKLKIVFAGSRLENLAVPPVNRLEALKGDRRGQWSIRVNEQWRSCFVWDGMKTTAIEVVDCH